MAVASFQPAAVVYREEQNFAWWVYALLVGVELFLVLILAVVAGDARNHAGQPHLPVPRDILALSLTLVPPALIMVGLLRLTTEVMPSEVRVWFGWIPTYRRVVPVDLLQRVEVVTYRPVADYGGWGIRSGRDGERVLNARGNRGVRLYLSDGSRLLIGSQRPEALALALEQAIRPIV